MNSSMPNSIKPKTTKGKALAKLDEWLNIPAIYLREGPIEPTQEFIKFDLVAIISGNTGVGKSHWCFQNIKRYLMDCANQHMANLSYSHNNQNAYENEYYKFLEDKAKKYSVFFQTAEDLGATLADFKDDRKKVFYNRKDPLFIDDWECDEINPAPWRELKRLFRHRYARCLPMVVTTSLDRNGFHKSLDSRSLGSRAYTFDYFDLEGKNWRKVKPKVHKVKLAV